MGEKQGRAAICGCHEKCDEARCRRGIGPTRIYVVHLAVAALSVAAVLGPGLLAGRAVAQEPRTKSDAAVKTEAPPERVRDQAGQDSAPVAADALSSRYRFIEKYSPKEDPDHPELITQYRVGINETQKTVREKAQGAPDRAEISRSTIYTERAAQVGKLGEAIGVVRRYDKFRIKELAALPPAKPPLFEGLTVWLRRLSGKKPLVLGMSGDRAVRDYEFTEITKQVFLPQLAALLPPTPRRIDDTWPISREVAQCLVGELPDPDDYEMTGTLTEIRKANSGTALTAIIRVSGKLNLSLGLSALSAELHFVFEPALATTVSGVSPKATDSLENADRTKPAAGIVEARGKISRVLMLWAVSELLPDGGGRLKQTVTYELNLERRVSPPSGETAGAQNKALEIPEPLPTADQNNSWLQYDDPLGRFQFRHPQVLQLPHGVLSDPDRIDLVDQAADGGKDVLIVTLPSEDQDPAEQRQFRDPETWRRVIDGDEAKMKLDVLKGVVGWLPDQDWAPLKRKVYRIETAVKPASETAKKDERIYIDYYLVLFARNECIRLQAMTARDNHVAFRTQAESVIKSFQFNSTRDAKAFPRPPKRPRLRRRNDSSVTGN